MAAAAAGKVRPSSVYTLGAHARGERRQAGLAQYRCVDSKYSSLATTIAQPTHIGAYSLLKNLI